ncbi:MAG: DUF4296 domain-containing protein [Chitinophagaceae bacterium]|nr:MAG: DUF4296 domain-containing protein [Chitinophagaceae bacterium]
MMRLKALLLVLAFAACNRAGRLPDGVLPPERMAPVLKEVIAADEWVNWRVEQNQQLDARTERIHRYRAAFNTHGVSEQQFRTSFDYYKAHPLLLRTVLDTLQRQPNLDTSAAPAGTRRKPLKGPPKAVE